jgi:transposase
MNSHLPSSRDSASIKSKKKNSRRKKGGKVGGQENHKGNTLKRFTEVDEIFRCEERTCLCGCNLKDVEGVFGEARQLVDIPFQPYTVIEYQRIDKLCPNCHSIVKGVFPHNVVSNIQYGPNLQSFCVGLNTEYKIPYSKVSELLGQMYGLNVNTSTLHNMSLKCAQFLGPVEDEIKKYILSQDVIHADETGIIVNTENYWMHVLSNPKATYLKVHDKRGSDSFESELYQYNGHLVHDFYSSYFKLTNAKHNTCGAHIDRECEALIEEKSNWALKMKALLLELVHNDCKKNNESKRSIQHRYTRIINQGIKEEPEPIRTGSRGREKKSKGLNLLYRLRDHRDVVLEYAFNSEIPFTNNQAERDLRHCKVKMKVSGCFRSINGAKAYARISAFISTMRKNNQNFFGQLAKLLNHEHLVLNLT